MTTLKKIPIGPMWHAVVKTVKLSFGDVKKAVFTGTEKECDEFIAKERD